jgi:ribosomal protein S18 acetylase RimI-like enzyme
MNLENPVQIQKGLTSEQLPQAVALFDVAFESKMAMAIPDATIRRRFFANVFNAESCLSATLDGKVVGFVGFQTATEAFSGGITGVGIPWGKIRSQLGFLAAIRAALFFALFQRQPEQGTLILDGVTVDTALRGRGVGKLLMDAVIDYAGSQSFQQIKLGVLDTNVVAKALYEKVGFVVTGKKDFRFLKLVLGFGGYYIMIRPIDPRGKPISPG